MPARGALLSAYRRPRHLPDGFSQNWGYPSALSSLRFSAQVVGNAEHSYDIHHRRCQHHLDTADEPTTALQPPRWLRSGADGNATWPGERSRPAVAPPVRFQSAPSEATSTWATLPCCRISNTWPTKPGTGYHSGPYSTSRVSLVLHLSGHVAIRCYPEGPVSYVRLSRNGIVSTAPSFHAERLRGNFSGKNTEAPAYPSTRDVRSSAPSPLKFTGKGFRPFHG